MPHINLHQMKKRRVLGVLLRHVIQARQVVGHENVQSREPRKRSCKRDKGFLVLSFDSELECPSEILRTHKESPSVNQGQANRLILQPPTYLPPNALLDDHSRDPQRKLGASQSLPCEPCTQLQHFPQLILGQSSPRAHTRYLSLLIQSPTDLSLTSNQPDLSITLLAINPSKASISFIKIPFATPLDTRHFSNLVFFFLQ